LAIEHAAKAVATKTAATNQAVEKTVVDTSQ
jgi:hypothetical protein